MVMMWPAGSSLLTRPYVAVGGTSVYFFAFNLPNAGWCTNSKNLNSGYLTTSSFLFFCFSCRACEVGGSLCHMSEGRDKNCQQREAQRVGVNEGNFLMGDLKKNEVLGSVSCVPCKINIFNYV